MLDLRTPRKRALKVNDLARRDETVSNFLADLATAAFSRVNPQRFVAFSCDNNVLSGAGLSPKVARELHAELQCAGFVEGKIGFRQRHYIDIMVRSGRTRLRATQALRDLFEECGLTWTGIANPVKDVVRLKRAEPNAGPEPAAVVTSRSVLARINARIALSVIALPETAWAEEAAHWKPEYLLNAKERANLQHAGDLSAIALHRSFSRNWTRGGRLYGGWWQNVSKRLRPAITIDGEATVEIDYGQQHPTMLYARANKLMEDDPYVIAGMDVVTRDLGKNTFARMLNFKPTDHQSDGPKDVSPQLKHLLPAGVTGAEYLKAYRQHVAPVAHWFGKDEGARLQVHDSNLALAILDTLDRYNIVALPIHDSFVVMNRHRDVLIETMHYLFRDRHGATPVIRG